MVSAPERQKLIDEISELTSRIDLLRRRLQDPADIGSEDSLSDDKDTVAEQAEPVTDFATVVEGKGQPAPRHQVSTAGLSESGPVVADDTFESRYLVGEQLGEGGMGEVRVFTDKRVGREVAMKVLLPRAAKSRRLRERFLFEARVQGQLEHPSIVPVYDIGVRADGSTYFTMKRVHGETLRDVLADLRKGSKTTRAVFSRRRLLLAFQSVCQAVEFAHQRGVVHRDLKPANVMLGGFGEVSVLDWGVAKLAQDPEVSPIPAAAALLEEAHAATAVGEVLGTPGYMSPEQAAGQTDITAQSDVFALGAILFEILTLERLIPRDGDPVEDTLLKRYDANINERFPAMGISPVLSELCVQATRHDATQRTRSAKELFDVIERYLEGEGEERRRRTMSERLTRAALTSLIDAERPVPNISDPKQARADAIQHATQALALDPANRTALSTLVKLVTELPQELTPAAEQSLRAVEQSALRDSARRGAIAYLGVSLNMLLVMFIGVRSWLALGLISGLLMASAIIAYAASRQRAPSPWLAVPVLLMSMTAFSLTSAMYGPFTITPLLCSVNTAVLAVALDRKVRWTSAAIGIVAIIAPLVAQELGLIPPLWEIRDGVMHVLPHVIELEAWPTMLFLSLVMVGVVVIPVMLVGAERDARAAAERKLALHAHQMSDLLPQEAKEKLMAASITDSAR